MSESDFSLEEETWQEPARWTRGRFLRILAFFALVALAVVVIGSLTEKNAHLTAVDRATGVQRWRDKLPGAGAAVILWQKDDVLGVSACGRGDGGLWLIIDPSTGKVLHDRDWRPADGNPALVSVWIDPPTVGDPIATPEFTYDRASGSLVSAKGWTVKSTSPATHAGWNDVNRREPPTQAEPVSTKLDLVGLRHGDLLRSPVTRIRLPQLTKPGTRQSPNQSRRD